MTIDSRQNPNKAIFFDSAFPENQWTQPPISQYNIQFGETIQGEFMNTYFEMIPDETILIQELEAWDLASDTDINNLGL